MKSIIVLIIYFIINFNSNTNLIQTPISPNKPKFGSCLLCSTKKTIQVKDKLLKKWYSSKRDLTKNEHDNIPFLFLISLLSTYI